jgi:hypothetical protein
VKTFLVKALLVCLFLSTPLLFSQAAPEGTWEAYDGEWRHVSQQLTARAEATPAEKFAWRPAAGGRSTGEVYMHIVFANLYLLSISGPKMPAQLFLNTAMHHSPQRRRDVRHHLRNLRPRETGNGKNASCTGLLVAWTAGCHPLASLSTAPEICTPLPAVEAPLPKAPCSRSSHSTALKLFGAPIAGKEHTSKCLLLNLSVCRAERRFWHWENTTMV